VTAGKDITVIRRIRISGELAKEEDDRDGDKAREC
jgi:hypothetical protein